MKYAVTLELRDVGRYGFILPGTKKKLCVEKRGKILKLTVERLIPAHNILPSGRETWESVYATANELAGRVYADAVMCPAI